METIAKVFGTGILFASAIVLVAPISCVLGWIAGWAVALFFNSAVLGVLANFGVHGVTLPDFGVALGFVSAFLRTSTTVKGK